MFDDGSELFADEKFTNLRWWEKFLLYLNSPGDVRSFELAFIPCIILAQICYDLNEDKLLFPNFFSLLNTSNFYSKIHNLQKKRLFIITRFKNDLDKVSYEMRKTITLQIQF